MADEDQASDLSLQELFAGPFFRWTASDEPFAVEEADPALWETLRLRYDPTRVSEPLARVLEVARELKTKTVITEYRYIDADYRSEHSAFYSSTFVRYPSVCHRLHFIGTRIETLDELDRLDESAHLGYSVMRPLDERPVGRTLLRPPVEGVYCWGEETIHLVGRRFGIRGMPYVSQDAQYTRCAHSTMWMVLRHASLTSDLPKRTPSEIHLATSGGRVLGRNTPSDGLSAEQVLSGLHKLGCSAASFDLASDDRGGFDPRPSRPGRKQRAYDKGLDERLRRLLVPYINSQIPTLVYSERHIWVVVGYRKPGSGNPGSELRYFVHDDSAGPYLEVTPADDAPDRSPWRVAIPPMPKKLYLSAERAEIIGKDVLAGYELRAAASALDLIIPVELDDIEDPDLRDIRRLVDKVLAGGTAVSEQDLNSVESVAAIAISEMRRDPKQLQADRQESETIAGFISGIEALEKVRSLKEQTSVRTYAIDAERFKTGTLGRLPAEISRAYRLLQLPRYVWVVEFVHTGLRTLGEPDVIGEVVLDGTAHQQAAPGSTASLLAVHVWGVCTTHSVDHQVSRTVSTQVNAPYRTGAAQNRLP